MDGSTSLSLPELTLLVEVDGVETVETVDLAVPLTADQVALVAAIAPGGLISGGGGELSTDAVAATVFAHLKSRHPGWGLDHWDAVRRLVQGLAAGDESMVEVR